MSTGCSPSALTAFLSPRAVTKIELIALTLLVAAVIVATSWALRIPTVLGHDESVYAVMSRHWLEGTPATGVTEHRAPLLPALGLLVLAAGGSETALQATGAMWAIVAVVSIWWLGRMISGPTAGLLAATVFVFSSTVFDAATSYLTDLPAAALLIALTALLWSQFAVRGEPDRALLFAAPLAAGAYHLRYGAALAVVILFALTAVMFWSVLRWSMRPAAMTLGLLFILLLPHMANSTLTMGTPWQRVLYTSSIAGRDYYGQGLVEYIRWFPQQLAGRGAATLMGVGIAGTLLLWAKRRSHGTAPPHILEVRRGLTFTVVAALTYLVAIGIASHGDPRFVFFSVALLCVAGAAIVTFALRWAMRRSPSLVAVLLIVLAGGVLVHVSQLAPTQAGERRAASERDAVLLDAAITLRTQGGAGCAVLTSYVPQLTWYSECEAHAFGDPPEPGREDRLERDGWMVLFEEGKHQPEGETLEYYKERFVEVQTWDKPHEGLLGSAALYRHQATTR